MVSDEYVPRNRYRLIELLNERHHTFFGKLGSFDPSASGIGYLAPTQDTEQSPVILELNGALGQSGVQLFRNSRDMLDEVAAGQLLVAYNVNGAYAFSRARTDPRLGVVLPEDYRLAISRTAIAPKTTDHPELAFRFVDYLLSEPGQQNLAGPAGLFASGSGRPGDRSGLAHHYTSRSVS